MRHRRTGQRRGVLRQAPGALGGDATGKAAVGPVEASAPEPLLVGANFAAPSCTCIKAGTLSSMPVARKLEIRSGRGPGDLLGVGDEVAVADANDLADLRIAACEVSCICPGRRTGPVNISSMYASPTARSASSPRFPSAARWKSNLPSFLAALASSMCQATYRICRLILQILGADLQTTLN
jgi:hypothetical protein